jgi:radical SAM protein with 4Fe4S-binding SPASM domain
MTRELKKMRAYKLEEQLPLPTNMLVEVTNACNLSCVFCAHSKMKRNVGMMDLDLFQDIAKQAFDGGTREIGFYLCGEPLINKRLSEYVQLAKKIGFEYIYMDTNGVLATLDTMKPVLAAGINSIKFSINAGTKESYEKIHGRDAFDVVISNLKDLSAYIKTEKKNVGLFVSFVICKDTQQEVNQFCDRIKDCVDEINTHLAFNQGGHMYEMNDGIMVKPGETPVQAPCKMIFNRLHVTWEGLLTACCADFDNELVVANLRETPLQEAWNSEKMIHLRRMHLSNRIPTDVMCYNCIHNKNYPIKPI